MNTLLLNTASIPRWAIPLLLCGLVFALHRETLAWGLLTKILSEQTGH